VTEQELDELTRLRREVEELRKRDTDRPEQSLQAGLISDLISQVQGLRLETIGVKEAVAAHTNEVIRAMTRLPGVEANIVELKRWQEDHDQGCGYPDCPRRKAM
jgi:hypothetical protein